MCANQRHPSLVRISLEWAKSENYYYYFTLLRIRSKSQWCIYFIFISFIYFCVCFFLFIFILFIYLFFLFLSESTVENNGAMEVGRLDRNKKLPPIDIHLTGKFSDCIYYLKRWWILYKFSNAGYLNPHLINWLDVCWIMQDRSS